MKYNNDAYNTLKFLLLNKIFYIISIGTLKNRNILINNPIFAAQAALCARPDSGAGVSGVFAG